ncbi:response regulator [Desulfobacterales bacterium HSG16]|nr:response regulator [Desulfobacterales bacterium HSG16]
MNVLIVEDDPASREYLKDTMEMEGHDALTAENGQIGLELYAKFKPDVVLTDIEMPVMDGFGLLKAVRKRNEDSVIIMITAHGSEEYAVQALRLGANNYINKPVRHHELLPLLRKYESIVQNRTTGGTLPGVTVHREYKMKFDTRFDLIPQVADYIVSETGDMFKKSKLLDLRLALYELLINSVEYGNLEITDKEKREALKAGTLAKIHEKRMTMPDFGQRKITVDFKLDSSGCEWIISDEGKGFDWKPYVEGPNEEEGLLSFLSHGRGIFINILEFNEVEFIGAGNVVRVKKFPTLPE